MKQVLASIGGIMGSIGFLISIIMGTSITDGRVIIDFEAGVNIGIYPAVIGIVLLIIAGIMHVKEIIKN